MQGFWAAIRIGLLDMRGDMRRFALLVASLAVGTALIAGVSSVGASIRQAVEQDAALLMGGDIELLRADRAATDDELALLARFGQVSSVIDANVRAESGDLGAFVDLVAIGETYPLLGRIDSSDLPAGENPFAFLSPREGLHGALVDPLMLDQLGITVGDTLEIGGTLFEARGALGGLPDAAVRGFRLGLTAVITMDGLAVLSDRTSPLPGLGTWFRYKLLLDGLDAEAGKAAVETALADATWTVRSARDGLGPMVRYYDLFMRFLVIVGLASLLIGGVSVWTGISAYIAERANVIAVLRSMGAGKARVFLHFFCQVATLAATGVGIGLLVGAGTALLALPIVGAAVGVSLSVSLQMQPLLVAAGVGLLTAFTFSYLPLQQAQSISPVTLFRSKGLATPPMDWRALFGSLRIVPLILSAAAFLWLATILTDDPLLVAAFAAVSVLAVVVFKIALSIASTGLGRLPEPSNRVLRYALRDISGAGSNAPSVVVSVGLALAMLVVVLVLVVNLSNEYLGASVFDAPTLVASDLFDDEVETLQALKDEGGDIAGFTAAPMLRGALTAVNGTPAGALRPRGPEASFLLSGEVPLTFRRDLPSASRLVAGQWWPADYQGPALVSLHQSLRSGLGVNLGDELTFTIFGGGHQRQDRQFPRLLLAGRDRFPRHLFSRRARGLSRDAAWRGHGGARPRGCRRTLSGRSIPGCALHRHRGNARADHRRARPAFRGRRAGRRPCGRQRPAGPAWQPRYRPTAAPGRCGHHQSPRRNAARSACGFRRALPAAGRLRRPARNRNRHRLCVDADAGAARCRIRPQCGHADRGRCRRDRHHRPARGHDNSQGPVVAARASAARAWRRVDVCRRFEPVQRSECCRTRASGAHRFSEGMAGLGYPRGSNPTQMTMVSPPT